MTDLEIVKKCAEKMGYEFFAVCSDGVTIQTKKHGRYDPLHDDAQAMALVKKFRIDIDSGFDSPEQIIGWTVYADGSTARNADLNRAICECVARMP